MARGGRGVAVGVNVGVMVGVVDIVGVALAVKVAVMVGVPEGVGVNVGVIVGVGRVALTESHGADQCDQSHEHNCHGDGMTVARQRSKAQRYERPRAGYHRPG